MANQAELPSSLRNRQPTEKIGSFYLSLALDPSRQMNPDRPYQQCTFTFVQIETHDNLMGGTIPFSLTRQMQLPEYSWQQNHPFQLTRFFWGSNHPATDMQEALGTIEVARGSHPRTDPGKPETEYKYPSLVRLAGVDRTTHRVIALTYNARGAMELQRMHVSLKDDEFLPVHEESVFYRPRLAHIQVDTLDKNSPTSLADPYENAGFITEAMIRETEMEGWNSHERLLKIEGEQALPFSERELISEDGFFLRREQDDTDNSFYVVEFDPSVSPRNWELPAWEIRVPARLELADF